ncbi:MAG: glycosyltransferase, partial [Bacteroidota bacterium]
KGLHQIKSVQEKSVVLYLGMDLDAFFDIARRRQARRNPPVLLWNHRWEYDKAPEAFFAALFQLQEEGLAFRLAVLGEHYRKAPPIFAEAKEKLAKQIVHWGYAERETYQNWLVQTDILPVTSRQDFFGGSLVEGIAAGAIPLVPNRLAFPEHIPNQHRPLLVYDSDQDLFQRLRSFLKHGVPIELRSDLRNLVSRYDWSTLAPVYDRGFNALLQANQ